jgi:hypothetical protein
MIGLLILTELGLLGSQYRDVGPVPLEQPTDESTLHEGGSSLSRIAPSVPMGGSVGPSGRMLGASTAPSIRMTACDYGTSDR